MRNSAIKLLAAAAALASGLSVYAAELAAFVPGNKTVEAPGYLSCYDQARKLPRFVVFELGPGPDGPALRDGRKFCAEGGSASPKPYAKSGLDLGHCFPAEDADRDEATLRAPFSMRNAMPQYAALNRGGWKELELQLRSRAAKSRIVVVAGPLFYGPSPATLGGETGIPDACFKAAYDLDAGTREAWLFPNAPQLPGKELKAYASGVEDIEKLADLIFAEARHGK